MVVQGVANGQTWGPHPVVGPCDRDGNGCVMTIDVLFVQGAGDGAHAEDGLLADSLARALGSGYQVHYPKMPAEAEPGYEAWRDALFRALARLRSPIVLVGHSVGGSWLLRLLAEKGVHGGIVGLVLLAAPSRDESDWDFEDLELPEDTADRLASIPRIVLYHGREDDVVPFAHLGLHAARLPRALVRPVDGVGHQFGNDLSAVAQDIRSFME